MSNAINQNKKIVCRCSLTTKKITFLIAILFAIGLNSSYAQNSWKKKADFGGTARYGAVGFSIGSKGYIGTGMDGSNRNDFWEYDPATNAWTQKANFGGSPRRFATGFSIGTKGYIGTGQEDGYINKNDLWEYDPATNAWKQKANFGGEVRLFAVGFSIGSKGYISTGSNFDCCGGGDLYKDLWEYDPETDKWTKKADFGGAARWVAVGLSLGNKGYIGTGSNIDQSVYYRDFWEYDPGTDTWTKKTDYPGAYPTGGTGFSIEGKGYVGTGQDHGAGANDFWEYDPGINKWTQKANFGGSARWHAIGFSIGTKGYIGTGAPFYTKDFWEYAPSNSCPEPTGLKVVHVSDTCAILTWNVTGNNINKVQARYRALGEATWTKQRKNPDRNRMYINELTPNSTYQWQLRSLCAEDTSGWVKGPDFTTAVSFGSITKASAYPNPAKNTVTVNYTAQKNGKYIFEITDISGNVLLRKESNAIPGTNRITLDVSRLFKGIYFVNIINPDKTRERMQLQKE